MQLLELPSEMIELILGKLDLKSLYKATGTCKQLYRTDNFFWYSYGKETNSFDSNVNYKHHVLNAQIAKQSPGCAFYIACKYCDSLSHLSVWREMFIRIGGLSVNYKGIRSFVYKFIYSCINFMKFYDVLDDLTYITPNDKTVKVQPKPDALNRCFYYYYSKSPYDIPYCSTTSYLNEILRSYDHHMYTADKYSCIEFYHNGYMRFLYRFTPDGYIVKNNMNPNFIIMIHKTIYGRTLIKN